MGDRMLSDERLEAALRMLRDDVAFPSTPSFGGGVTERLVSDRARQARPRFPGLALWSRRRVLVIATIGLLAALALAAAARLTIGAVQIRVQPGVTPSASLPPVEPDVLGDPLPPQEAVALAGFEPALPPGPAPDEVYVVDTPFGHAGLVHAWRPSRSRPEIPGTGWGQLLLTFRGDDDVVVKTVDRPEDAELASVNGAPAFWISVAHPVVFETERGAQTLLARGNVLIWELDGITYRLETTLGKAAADALAESIG